MADGSDNWWNGWLQTAKEKSSSVLEFMKKDLDEFSNTFQQETSSFVSSTAATLRQKLHVDDSESTANKVKRSVSGIIGSVSTALSISPEPNEEDDDDVPFVIRDSEPVILSRLELQLVLMQRETSTYLIEPPGKPEDYESWLEKFNLNGKRDEMTELMSTNAYVRSLYGKLVPSQVSHSLFWHRYFYRVHQLYVAEAKRSMLKERAAAAGGEGTDLAWDEDDEISTQPLTPQETDRILSEYQKECEERELGSRLSETALFDKDAKRDDDDVQSKDSIRQNDEKASVAPKSLAEEISAETFNVPIANDKKLNVAVVQNKKEEISLSGKVSDGSSNDDEWEKDFYVAVTDEDVQKVLKEETSDLANNQGDEEWEKWQ